MRGPSGLTKFSYKYMYLDRSLQLSTTTRRPRRKTQEQYNTIQYNPMHRAAAQRLRLPTPRRVPCVTYGSPHHAHTQTGLHLDLADWALPHGGHSR